MMFLRIRRLVLSAVLSAVALSLFVLEAQLPLPAPVPGLKLGLSNVITVFALFALGWREALAILLVRIFLGSIFTGQGMALLYSLGGGLLSFVCMALARRILRRRQMWVCGVLGGIAHNIGQIVVAVLVLENTALLWYLPVLVLCGMATGALTGFSAQLVLERFHKGGLL